MNRKLLITSCMVCMAMMCFGQSNPFDNPSMSDAFSRPLYMRYNYVADGSPYLFDDYIIAEVTLDNGKTYPDVKVKYNLVDREVVFKDDKNEELVVTVPVKSIRFFNSIVNEKAQAGTKLESVGKAINEPNAPIYDVLSDGKARLLKLINVTYTDQKKYGEANVTRTFTKKETYYVIAPGTTELKKLEKNKSDIAALFGKQQAQVFNFIESNKLKCKSDEDLKKVFDYYNSL